MQKSFVILTINKKAPIQRTALFKHREETFVANPYSAGLEQNPANYVPLSPLSFIERSAFVYPKRISIIQGARQYLEGEL